MKYIIAILIVLSVGGYFAYKKADEYYEARVSGELRVMFNKYDMVQFESGDVQANFKAGTVKTKWENAWDAWPALATGALLGIVAFGGLFLTTADKLVNAELSSHIEDLKKRLASETERADNAQVAARKELKQEREAAKTLQREADKITIEAEVKMNNAKRFEQEAKSKINQAFKYAKQMEQERDQAKKDSGHAISGINRHKRKLDKLKSDDDAIKEFIKQYHADLLQNAD